MRRSGYIQEGGRENCKAARPLSHRNDARGFSLCFQGARASVETGKVNELSVVCQSGFFQGDDKTPNQSRLGIKERMGEGFISSINGNDLGVQAWRAWGWHGVIGDPFALCSGSGFLWAFASGHHHIAPHLHPHGSSLRWGSLFRRLRQMSRLDSGPLCSSLHQARLCV